MNRRHSALFLIQKALKPRGEGITLRLFRWGGGGAAGTLEPLAYTRAVVQ